MTMARIGERAGMSHGIVNYYFKSKDELVSRRGAQGQFPDHAGHRPAACAPRRSPRERVSAVIAGNFPPDLFTREIARAWVSYYAAIGQRRILTACKGL